MQISGQKCSQTEKVSISAPIAPKDYDFIFKSKIIFWFKISVAILALWFLFTTVSMQVILQILRAANWQFLIIAFFILGPNIFIQVWKWHYLLKLANAEVSFANAFKSFIIGYPLGFVTPGRIGEIGRAFYVKEISQGKTLRIFAFDKFSNLLMTVLIGSFATLILLKDTINPGTKNFLLLLSTLIAGLVLYFIFFTSAMNKLVEKFTRIDDFSKTNLIIVLLFSFGFYWIFITQYLLLMSGFTSGPVALISTTEAAAATFFTKSLLPISFGDLGIREGAAVFFFTKIGQQPAAALNASLLLFILNVGIPALIGLPILLRTRRDII